MLPAVWVAEAGLFRKRFARKNLVSCRRHLRLSIVLFLGLGLGLSASTRSLAMKYRFQQVSSVFCLDHSSQKSRWRIGDISGISVRMEGLPEGFELVVDSKPLSMEQKRVSVPVSRLSEKHGRLYGKGIINYLAVDLARQKRKRNRRDRETLSAASEAKGLIFGSYIASHGAGLSIGDNFVTAQEICRGDACNKLVCLVDRLGLDQERGLCLVDAEGGKFYLDHAAVGQLLFWERTLPKAHFWCKKKYYYDLDVIFYPRRWGCARVEIRRFPVVLDEPLSSMDNDPGIQVHKPGDYVPIDMSLDIFQGRARLKVTFRGLKKGEVVGESRELFSIQYDENNFSTIDLRMEYFRGSDLAAILSETNKQTVYQSRSHSQRQELQQEPRWEETAAKRVCVGPGSSPQEPDRE